jgi:hypothetical protein
VGRRSCLFFPARRRPSCRMRGRACMQACSRCSQLCHLYDNVLWNCAACLMSLTLPPSAWGVSYIVLQPAPLTFGMGGGALPP